MPDHPSRNSRMTILIPILQEIPCLLNNTTSIQYEVSIADKPRTDYVPTNAYAGLPLILRIIVMDCYFIVRRKMAPAGILSKFEITIPVFSGRIGVLL